MLIRRVQPSDLRRILSLNNKSGRWVGKKDGKWFEKYLDIPLFNVAEEKGKVYGFIMAMDQNTDYDSPNFLWFKDWAKKKRKEGFVYVDRVVVEQSKRRQGIASFLYGRLLREQNGYPLFAEVCVKPFNGSSVNFHEQMGFEQVGQTDVEVRKGRRKENHTNRMYARS